MYQELLNISDDASTAMHNLQSLVTEYAREAEWTDDPTNADLTETERERLQSIAIHFETISRELASFVRSVQPATAQCFVQSQAEVCGQNVTFSLPLASEKSPIPEANIEDALKS